jgi:hypothetical protein
VTSPHKRFAWVHAGLCTLVILFHLAVMAVAPWGAFTQGGGVEGALPASGRVAAGVSALLMVLAAALVLSAAGVGPRAPRWTAYAAFGVILLGFFLNLATPSVGERLLWAPITAVMVILQALILRAHPEREGR